MCLEIHEVTFLICNDADVQNLRLEGETLEVVRHKSSPKKPPNRHISPLVALRTLCSLQVNACGNHMDRNSWLFLDL